MNQQMTFGAWATSTTVNGVQPHSAPNMFVLSGGSGARLYRTLGLVLTAGSAPTLTFWMYHSTSLPGGSLQVQVDAGGGFSNVGSPISVNDGTTGWSQHSVSLGAFAGQTIKIGFLGQGNSGGHVYLDDIRVTA